nr:MAG TPA: hypothetical protein [Caudoviricetes sp.]
MEKGSQKGNAKKGDKLISAVVVLMLMLVISNIGRSKDDDSPEKAQTVAVETVETQEDEHTEDIASTEDAVTTEEDEKQALKDDMIQKYHLVVLAGPHDDKTGKLHVAGYTAVVHPQDIAEEYYKAFFEDDSEIHCLWSNAYNTISKVSLIDSNTLDVTVHEYRDKEEHYADQILGGQVYEQYLVHLDTGEVEKVDLSE